jgi:hypothetical protein
MAAVAVADADEVVGVDPPMAVRERLEAFAGADPRRLRKDGGPA